MFFCCFFFFSVILTTFETLEIASFMILIALSHLSNTGMLILLLKKIVSSYIVLITRDKFNFCTAKATQLYPLKM